MITPRELWLMHHAFNAGKTSTKKTLETWLEREVIKKFKVKDMLSEDADYLFSCEEE